MNRVIVDSNTGFVFYSNKKIGALNIAEKKILLYLLSMKGEVAQKEDIISIAWENSVTVPNSLNVAIRNIRILLSKVSAESFIITIPRVGFSIPNYSFFLVSSTSFINEQLDISLKKTSEMTSFLPSSPLEIKHAMIKRIFKYFYTIFFSVVLLSLTFLNVIFFISKPVLTCYDYKQSKYCGTFEEMGDVHGYTDDKAIYIFGRNYHDHEEIIYIRVN
ncbi:winged helix-turn-helix domain-containing protein [Serratia sp. N21D137]|uniref:winged helix-turn-helix domain-containing protein n=1 Tax=Serratia sp. N21D137 TaxID=3397495 RepID=UPI0039E08372